MTSKTNYVEQITTVDESGCVVSVEFVYKEKIIV